MTWKPGESGNPSGVPKGSRRAKLSEAFIKKLHQDWRHNGISAIEQLRETSIVEYIKVIASVLPKEGHVSKTVKHHHTHESVSETDAWVAGMLEGYEDRPIQEPVQN